MAPRSPRLLRIPTAIEFFECPSTLVGDFFIKGLSRHIEEDQGVVLHHFLLHCSFMLQACKDKLANKAELEKKLTEEPKRCQTLRKKMEQEMKAPQAKYKDQIQGLKDES
ncbi:hypothetical protein ACOSQ2_022972 [Xanthoceras sorbifolium]